MNKIKPILITFLILLVMACSSGAAFGFPDGYLTIEFSKNTAKVNDTVDLTVTAYNTGTVGWNNVILFIPTPNGLKYLMHYTTISRMDYSPSSGSWLVENMRHDQHGKTKTLYITLKVLPEANGRTITANARFTNIILENNGEHFENNISSASDTLKIIDDDGGSGNGTGNGNGNGTGQGNGTGNGDGNGTGTGNSTGNGTKVYEEIFGNITDVDMASIGTNQLDESNSLQNSNGGGGGGKGNNKNAYEITKVAPTKQTPSNWLYGLLAGLVIVGLVLFGYLNRMRNG